MTKIPLILCLGLFFAASTSRAADTFAQKDLEGTWKGSWVTPKTKFTYTLTFKVDAKGSIKGTYGHPNEKANPGLGGTLTLSKADGQISGDIKFGSDVVFNAQQDVKIEKVTEGNQTHLRISGLFITKAFPGELGKDQLDVTKEEGK